MTMRSDDDDDRPATLRRLSHQHDASAALEHRVVASLTARGVLQSPRRRRVAWALAAAAVVLAFVGGRMTAAAGTPPGPDGMPQWLLLLYEDGSFRGPAPGQEGRYVEEYSRWAAGLAAEQRLVAAGELPPGGVLIDPDGRGQPHTEATRLGATTGYFLIKAESAERAREIAATCPHLRHGGRIVIRPTS